MHQRAFACLLLSCLFPLRSWLVLRGTLMLLSGVDRQFSLKQARTLDHTPNSKRIKLSEIARGDTASIILHLELQMPLPHVKPDPDTGSMRVLRNIGERFLKNSKYSHSHVRFEFNVRFVARYLTRDAIAFREFTRFPFYCRKNAKIHDTWPQVPGNTLYRMYGAIHQVGNSTHFRK